MQTPNHRTATLRLWWRAETGAITMEFMIWFPLLVLWTLACISAFDAFKSRNSAAKAAYAISDIVSRMESVTGASLDEIYELQRRLLPRVGGTQELQIASIAFDGTDYTLEWSYAPDGVVPLGRNDIPAGILPEMAAGDTVVFTRFGVPYQPVLNIAGIGSQTWRLELFTRPRSVVEITRTDVAPLDIILPIEPPPNDEEPMPTREEALAQGGTASIN